MGVKARRTKRRKGYNVGEVLVEDRLSSLPDVILVEILSLLPLKSAIATGALSSRWQGLWRQVTSFCIEERHLGTSNLFTTVHDLLYQFNSPVIRKFSLVFHQPKQDSNLSLMDSWFTLICGRKVEEIQVSSASYTFKHGLPPPPPCVFRTQSLVVLELAKGFRCKLPDGGEFNLPNLKKLHIELYACTCELLTKLINSCPVLEDLDLRFDLVGKHGPTIVDISGHNLQRLGICTKKIPKTTEFIIDAPKLEGLRIQVNDPLKFCFVESPMRLLEAGIVVLSPCSRARMTRMKDLFGAECNVRSLKLNGLELGRATLFPNLTHLTFKTSYSGRHCEEFIALLHCCPVLEVLILTPDILNERIRLTPPHSAPMLIHLKRIEIEIWISKLRFKNWLDLVKYLLSRAPILERLIVDVNEMALGKVARCNESKLYKELYESPRISLHCQIDLSVTYWKASGNGKEVRRHYSTSPSLP